ncbi:MFS transporter [Arenibacter algicola]|uniref:MFS transporter n=1 Tax=Arenibacter algicola TaxID=616991 RepID=UPI001C070400|nr:MFS transporter [Arenibacter algicola]MBU2904104.1 MFS transporter [Arenibacter algicola]
MINIKRNDLYKWELIAWLWLAFFFNQADRQVFNVLLPLIKEDLGLTDTQIGIISSLFVLCVGVCIPIAGFVGDLYSRKKIIIISLFFWSVATFFTGMSYTVIQLILLRSLAVGGGEAFYAPSANAIISEYHNKTRAMAMSIHQTSLYIGVILSGVIGGIIAEHFGWRSAFYIFGGFGILLSALLLWRLKPSKNIIPSSNSSERKKFIKEAFFILFKKPSIVLLGGSFVCLVFVNVGYLTWMPLFLHEKFNLSITDSGFSSMFYHHIFAFVGIIGGGILSDKLAVKSKNYRLVIQGIGLLLGAPFIFGMGQATELVWVYIYLAGFGLFRGIYEANFVTTIFAVIEPKYRASVIGLVYLFVFSIGSISPFLLGYYKQSFGLSNGVSALGFAYILGGILVLIAMKWFFKKDSILQTAEL